MPLRVLYWNIENFAINKINNPDTVSVQVGSSLSQNVASQERLNYVMTNIKGPDMAQRPPEIIVVVEVETAYNDGEQGMLARGAGILGARELLNELRLGLGLHWSLVPPLKTGPNETVAVFYDSRTLMFSGPYVWPGGEGGVSGDRAAGTVPAAYPMPFAGFFPQRAAGRERVPAGALQNVDVPEAHCAARVQFNRAPAVPGGIGARLYQTTRAPYLATFAEINPATGALVRNITIAALHAPASYPGSREFLNELAATPQINAAAGNREARLVVGDLNINLMREDLTLRPEYSEFIADVFLLNGLLYSLLLRPPVPPPPNPAGFAGYYATHMKTRNSAKWWSTGEIESFYPGYGYIGHDDKDTLYAIDNAFVAYADNGDKPANHQMTIMNGVVGAPFDAVPPPIGVDPGFYRLPIQVATPRYRANPPVAPQFAAGDSAGFRGWDNFGRIRSTSDHIALLFDI